MPNLTPYQRGNRDGLLGLANKLDERATLHQASADSIGKDRPNLRSSWHDVMVHDLIRANCYREAARMARRLAEGLPEETKEKA